MSAHYSNVMEIRYYPDTDVLWVELTPFNNSRGRLVDNNRILHFNDGGSLAAVEFLYASEGVDLQEIQDGARQEILEYIRQNVDANLPVAEETTA